MKAIIYAFSMVILGMMATGCATGSVEDLKEAETETNEKVISNLILYQYGKELKSWKDQRPKVMQ